MVIFVTRLSIVRRRPTRLAGNHDDPAFPVDLDPLHRDTGLLGRSEGASEIPFLERHSSPSHRAQSSKTT
jgi:hypothetical protein